MLRKLRYLLEAFLLFLLFLIFRLLPVEMASNLGSFIARALGPKLGSHKTARRNLAQAFPEKSREERETILNGMWDNLGRVIGEFPYLPGNQLTSRTIIEGMEHIEAHKQNNKPVIFISGHIANWEMAPRMAAEVGLPLMLVYRKANNPWSEWLIRTTRTRYSADLIPKSVQGLVRVAKALIKGQSVGMLVDQKTNDGIAVKFFGRDAMTSSSTISLAMKFEVPLLPVQIIRTGGPNFIIRIHPSFNVTSTGNKEQDIQNGTQKINDMLEGWIRQHPEQWLWVHNRWPKEK